METKAKPKSKTTPTETKSKITKAATKSKEPKEKTKAKAVGKKAKVETKAKPDILKHELVPEHEIISKKDADEVLNKYNITKGQLPKIFSTDPVVKMIKAETGDILKITRNSKTAGKSIFYRVVVAQV